VNPQKTMAQCPSYINYLLKGKRFVIGYVQPVIVQYKSTTTSAIKVATMKKKGGQIINQLELKVINL